MILIIISLEQCFTLSIPEVIPAFFQLVSIKLLSKQQIISFFKEMSLFKAYQSLLL